MLYRSSPMVSFPVAPPHERGIIDFGFPKSEVGMPIYEYRCSDCKKKVSVFFRSLSRVDHGQARCPECSGANLTRLVSRVRAIRSEDSRLDNLADDSALAG